MKTLLAQIVTPLRRFLVSLVLSSLLALQPFAQLMRAWPFANRRRMAQNYHRIGDRRQTLAEKVDAWLGLESPDPARTLRVHLTTAIATCQVVIIVAAVAPEHREILLLIPTFCLYAACLLAYRQYRIAWVGSQAG